MEKLKDVFRVDEVTIGHGGDYTVGLASEYSSIQLSDELADILDETGMLEQFKRELFDLLKKYDDEVCEMQDDVTELGSSISELIANMSYKEILERIEVLEKERQESIFSKTHKIELYLLKQEVEKNE